MPSRSASASTPGCCRPMLPGQIAEAHAADVGDVFAQGEFAVHVQIIDGDEAVVLFTTQSARS